MLAVTGEKRRAGVMAKGGPVALGGSGNCRRRCSRNRIANGRSPAAVYLGGGSHSLGSGRRVSCAYSPEKQLRLTAARNSRGATRRACRSGGGHCHAWRR